ncbi:hypothetical protein Trydic_g19715 [Trypoxylus dichotomus]
MSILYENELGYFICHASFIRKIYQQVNFENSLKSFGIQKELFHIKYPYTKFKLKNLKRLSEEDDTNNAFQTEVQHVENIYTLFYSNLVENKIIDSNSYAGDDFRNKKALLAAQHAYDNSGIHNLYNVIGENTDDAVGVEIKGSRKFDVIVLDPPWWNKYIRRKKMKTDNSYTMMYNDDLKELPVEKLIKDNGIVIIWCTNSPSHMDYLRNVIFEKWKVKFMKKWYWLKVTIAGKPVCNFSKPPGKQPFEQIIFASRSPHHHVNIPDERLVMSVPSALHSHKPPLQEMIQKYIPENADCLEVFARYLLPDWTSYGLEAIRFQHHSLYTETT